MIAILGKSFITCLISSNNRNLQLLTFRKYILYWGFYEMCNSETATMRGCHLGYTDTFKNQRYEGGLPWKEADNPLPDNHSLSQRKLQSLVKRLSRKREQLKKYDRVIKDQLDKGIIRRVSRPIRESPALSSDTLPSPSLCCERRQVNNQASHCVQCISKREWASIKGPMNQNFDIRS